LRGLGEVIMRNLFGFVTALAAFAALNGCATPGLDQSVAENSEAIQSLKKQVEAPAARTSSEDTNAVDPEMEARLDELEKDFVQVKFPMVEPRPDHPIPSWKFEGENLQQKDGIYATTAISAEIVRQYDPSYSGESLEDSYFLDGVVPAFTVTGENPENGENDYAVTKLPVEIDGVSKHRAIPAFCVYGGLAGLDYYGEDDPCYTEIVSVECDAITTESCQLNKIHEDRILALVDALEHFKEKNPRDGNRAMAEFIEFVVYTQPQL